MEYLLYTPLDTGWELFTLIASVASYCVMDYSIHSKPKRSNRTERQIFDGYLEVSEMIFAAVTSGKFESLDGDSKRGILRFVYKRYK